MESAYLVAGQGLERMGNLLLRSFHWLPLDPEERERERDFKEIWYGVLRMEGIYVYTVPNVTSKPLKVDSWKPFHHQPKYKAHYSIT